MTEPSEFCQAMSDLVTRSQLHPATAVDDQAYQMKLRVLDFFISRGPDRTTFERMLRERIADQDPQKELSRSVCCQILNTWLSGSCYYTPEGRLVLKSLYPADFPPGLQEGDAEAGE